MKPIDGVKLPDEVAATIIRVVTAGMELDMEKLHIKIERVLCRVEVAKEDVTQCVENVKEAKKVLAQHEEVLSKLSKGDWTVLEENEPRVAIKESLDREVVRRLRK